MAELSSSITFTSIVSALIYGLLFSFFIEFIDIFACLTSFSFLYINNRNTTQDNDIQIASAVDFKTKPIAITILTIFLFGIAFLVLSYDTLDGKLRLYLLLIMLTSYKAIDHFLLSRTRTIFLRFACNINLHLKKFLKKAAAHLKNRSHLIKNGKNDQMPPLDKVKYKYYNK